MIVVGGARERDRLEVNVEMKCVRSLNLDRSLRCLPDSAFLTIFRNGDSAAS
jgi:hypothetical protein